MELSIIIPTRSRRETLARCIATLLPQIKSVQSNIEIIVVDDGSTDDTGVWLKAESQNSNPALFRYFRQSAKGPAAARNLGLKYAEGKLILFLGDDIFARKNMLVCHLTFHRDQPANHIAMLGKVEWSPEIRKTSFMDYLNRGTQFGYSVLSSGEQVGYQYFYTANISLKREFMLNNGMFDESFPYAVYEDVELGYRLVEKGLKIIYQPEAVGYHYHQVNLKSYCLRQRYAGRAYKILLTQHSQLSDGKQNERVYPLPKYWLAKFVLPFAEILGWKWLLYRCYDVILAEYKYRAQTEFGTEIGISPDVV